MSGALQKHWKTELRLFSYDMEIFQYPSLFLPIYSVIKYKSDIWLCVHSNMPLPKHKKLVPAKHIDTL